MSEQEIYIAAINQRDPAERRRFLAEVCANNEALRERIETLIRQSDQLGSFLENSPQPFGATAGFTAAAERPGAQIGPYKLLQPIGEGGMGAVYMAEQSQPVQRKVALKVIKAGMDSGQVIARFEAERQTLALMDHPNIAKVLDAGTTGPASGCPGRPYFVMELIKGVPITQYCDENHLPPKARLELFTQVCHAVQHAHQKGIIHRDIKPTNVLVTLYDDKPMPKVIDFGVAKAMGGKLTERTMFTGFGQIVGTLEYMSPEQARLNALDVDTRGDIYSLGVLLYELLTGTTPLEKQCLREAAFDEMLRMIREQEPPRPSTRLSTAESRAAIAANRSMEPDKLSGLVRGELDWIVMKALEKDRNRRYETANGFAMDVQRYLADEAVLACPPSAGYRFRKFARRNKSVLVVAGVILFFITLLGSVAGWAVRDRAAREAIALQQRQAHEAELARERRERALSIQAEVNLALKEAERLQEQGQWLEALSATRRAESLLAGGGSDEVHQRVQQFRKDLDIVLRLEEPLSDLGGVLAHERRNRDIAQVFADLGIDVERLTPTEVAARIQSRPSTAVRLAAALDEWAQILRDWGKWDQSRRDPATWKHRLEAARLADPDPWRSQLRQLIGQEDLNALRELADSSDIATVPVQSLRLMGAALMFGGDRRACVAWLRKAHRQHPGDPWISFDLAHHLGNSPSPDWREVLRFAEAGLAARPTASMYNFVGNVLDKLGHYDEAIACIGKAIELRPDFDSAHRNLGDILTHQGKLDEAIVNYRKAIELSPDWSWPYANLGSALATQGKLDEAIAYCRKSVELSPEWYWSHVNLGHGLTIQGKPDEAIAAYREGLRLKPDHQPTHRRLGELLAQQDRLDEAISALREATRLKPNDARAHRNLGDVLAKQGQLDVAVTAFREAIRLKPDDKTAQGNLASALRRVQLDKAVADSREAVRVRPDDHLAHFNLGIALYNQRLFDEAIQAYRTSLALGPEQASIYEHLGLALAKTDDFFGAIAAYKKAVELNPKSVSAHSQLGDALRTSGEVDQAIAVYRTLIELSPKSAPAHKSLGRALRDKGEVDSAIAAFEEALRLQPIYEAAQFELAAALAQSKKWDRSASVYAEALPRYNEVWPGPWYEAIGSDEVFTRLTALPRDDPLPWIMRARLRCLQGDWKGAAADYDRANLSLASLDQAQLHRHSDALIGYACVLLVLDDRSGYEQFCQKWADRVGQAQGWDSSLARAWAIGPRAAVSARQIVERASKEVERHRLPWNLQTLSLAHYRCGEFELAIERASESNAGGWNGSAKALNWFVLAMAHHRLGHVGEARKSLERARMLVGQPCPLQPPGMKWFYMAPTDALEVELLRREAEALIEG